MSLETFEFVVDLVLENIQKHLTTFRDTIKVENPVAIGIWRRETRNSYRAVSKVFGFGKSTVIKITADFVKGLVRSASRLIKFPKTNCETASAVQLFKSFCNGSLPQVLGAIDGARIEILKTR